MKKIIVAGSINMDVIARVEKLPLPGETVSGSQVQYLAGGKGLNQAAAAAKVEADTFLIGKLGNDVFADTLRRFLQDQNISADYIGKSDKGSGTAFITVSADGQNTIVVVPGSNADVTEDDVSKIEISDQDIVICQFEIPIPTVLGLFRRAKAGGARTILNPSPIRAIPSELLALTDILIVNETELGFLCSVELTVEMPIEEIAAAAVKIKSDAQTIIVTLGGRGAVLLFPAGKTGERSGGNSHFEPAVQVPVIDTVGAGDCFSGVFAAHLLENKSMVESLRAANKAAAICVTRPGAAPSMPTKLELLSFKM